MFDKAWCENFSGAVTVCDPAGMIIYMNSKACENWAKDGGQALLGKNLLDCHPQPSKDLLREMLLNQSSNCYSIEKDGHKKLIYQTPVFDENKQYSGFMELILELPEQMRHFVR